MATHKLPTLTAEQLARHGGCVACAYLRGLTQCNVCRADRPNGQTLTRREIARLVREDGMSVAEAEASMGVEPGPIVN